MRNIYNIQPVSVGVGLSTETCSKIRLDAGYDAFATSMYFSYALINGDGRIVFTGNNILGEDVLAGWGTDDQYIVDAMAAKIGVTLA